MSNQTVSSDILRVSSCIQGFELSVQKFNVRRKGPEGAISSPQPYYQLYLRITGENADYPTPKPKKLAAQVSCVLPADGASHYSLANTNLKLRESAKVESFTVIERFVDPCAEGWMGRRPMAHYAVAIQVRYQEDGIVKEVNVGRWIRENDVKKVRDSIPPIMYC